MVSLESELSDNAATDGRRESKLVILIHMQYTSAQLPLTYGFRKQSAANRIRKLIVKLYKSALQKRRYSQQTFL